MILRLKEKPIGVPLFTVSAESFKRGDFISGYYVFNVSHGVKYIFKVFKPSFRSSKKNTELKINVYRVNVSDSVLLIAHKVDVDFASKYLPFECEKSDILLYYNDLYAT
jgi:hypothetical protein